MAQKSGHLILMHGYTGVGKTTAANKIASVLMGLGFRTEVVNNAWLSDKGIAVDKYRYETPNYFLGVNQIRHSLFLSKVRAAEAEIRKGNFVILDTTSKHRILRESVYELIGEYSTKPIGYDNFFIIHCRCPLNSAIAGLLLKDEFRTLISRRGFEEAVEAAIGDLKFEVKTTEVLRPEETIGGQYSPKIISYQTLDETASIKNYALYNQQDVLERKKLRITEQSTQASTYDAAHKYLTEQYVPDLEQKLQELGYTGKDWVLETIIAALAEKTRPKEFIELFSTETELSPEQYIEFLKMKKEETSKMQLRLDIISRNMSYPVDRC